MFVLSLSGLQPWNFHSRNSCFLAIFFHSIFIHEIFLSWNFQVMEKVFMELSFMRYSIMEFSFMKFSIHAIFIPEIFSRAIFNLGIFLQCLFQLSSDVLNQSAIFQRVDLGKIQLKMVLLNSAVTLCTDLMLLEVPSRRCLGYFNPGSASAKIQ